MILEYIYSVFAKIRHKKNNTIIRMRFVPKDLIIGESCLLGKKSKISNNVIIGNFTYLNSNIKEVIVESNTEIGNFCSIAPGVCIGLGNHYLNLVSTHPFLFNKYYKKSFNNNLKLQKEGLKDKDKRTIIESDVWIGANSIVNRGVKIGEGAVIASGAVVTKDVEPYSIVAGVPAKKIGYRFDEQTRKKLLNNRRNAFWKWDKEKLQNNFSLMYDIKKYIEYIETEEK